MNWTMWGRDKISKTVFVNESGQLVREYQWEQIDANTHRLIQMWEEYEIDGFNAQGRFFNKTFNKALY